MARIYGFELMQVAQALDLQKKVNHRQLSPQNEQLLKALRKQVVYPGCRGLNAIPDEVPRKPSPGRIDLRGSMLKEPGIAFLNGFSGTESDALDSDIMSQRSGELMRTAADCCSTV
ncbi:MULTISPECIES: hypothetical protein [unclassified Shewanella]|uniref:hypothetical protein n=1 Tax=unclassified Shewanella TaxID=196818 RepID=UPI0039B56113